MAAAIRTGSRGPTTPTGCAPGSPAAKVSTGTIRRRRHARRAQRSPITDGACGKPWVFRYKDLARLVVEAAFRPARRASSSAEPTAWVPCSKPIWLTELGCPAVDKGPNQPNVFPDPKSAEGALPYFSTGGRRTSPWSASSRRISATGTPARRLLRGGANPLSPLYGGRMVDPARLYVWAWDARPYPAFPLDAASLARRRQLAARPLAERAARGSSVGALIDAILADHGLPPADVGDGGRHGARLCSSPSPARRARRSNRSSTFSAWPSGERTA